MRGKPRPPVPSEAKVRINRDIRAPKVRVIAPEGEQLGILDIADALHRTETYGLDLVEVAPNADPPVCKIMDYGKFRYQESKKEHDRKKRGPGLKEIKLRPKTEDHDLEYKVKRLKEFLSESHKVKVTVMFRGREITHPEQAKVLLDKLVTLVGEEGQVEQAARLEGRNMILLMVPKS
ncbi:MAG: translation initiation factor IF-3 [Thermodesulfobacteriota bacterium]